MEPTFVIDPSSPETWHVEIAGKREGRITRYHSGRKEYWWGFGEPGMQNPLYETREEAIEAMLQAPRSIHGEVGAYRQQ